MAIVLDQRLSEICELATTAAGVARLKFGNRTAVFLSRGASLAAILPSHGIYRGFHPQGFGLTESAWCMS